MKGAVMAEKEQNPILKMALEIGPIVLFFLAYRWAPVSEGASDSEAQLEQILFATAVFVPVILATLAISWITTRHLPKMALVTAVLVVVFGGLTLWLRDDTFIKMKPTILYCVFALGLGIGLVRGESYLEYLMEGAVPMTREGWMSAANTTEVSLKTAASPTLSNRVASITPPNEKNASQDPASPRLKTGQSAGRVAGSIRFQNR